jgi:ABC-2 type transport system permease protein
MTFITEWKLYFIRKIKEAWRNPALLSMSAFILLMYLFLFAPLLKNLVGMPGFGPHNVLNTFLPGVAVVLSVYGGAFVGFRLCDEIRQGIIERFRVTPTSRMAILWGAIARDVVLVLLQAIILFLLAIPFGLQINWAGFVVLLVILGMNTALFAGFSYAIALKFQSEDALAPIVQGITQPVVLLGGFLLPMNMAPHWLKVAAHFDPVYYSVEASRSLMNGDFKAPAVWQVFAITIPLLFLLFRWAAGAFKSVIR